MSKTIQAAKTTITRDVDHLDQETNNVYEAVHIIGRRADQISLQIKEELNNKLEEFAVVGENLEEIYENQEQIEVSKHYERMPKPTALAIQEMMEGKVYWRRKDAAPEGAADAG